MESFPDVTILRSYEGDAFYCSDPKHKNRKHTGFTHGPKTCYLTDAERAKYLSGRGTPA